MSPDREYPTGAFAITGDAVTDADDRHLDADDTARLVLDALVAMSPEDRAALAAWLWPEDDEKVRRALEVRAASAAYDDDKADADAERMVDRRVVITNGDHQGRVGIVASYDADRGQLFVDLEAVDRPWSEPFTLACGPTEAALT